MRALLQRDLAHVGGLDGGLDGGLLWATLTEKAGARNYARAMRPNEVKCQWNDVTLTGARHIKENSSSTIRSSGRSTIDRWQVNRESSQQDGFAEAGKEESSVIITVVVNDQLRSRSSHEKMC